MRLTGSKVPLLTKCAYPFRSDLFPPTASRPAEAPSLDAQCGRALHRAAEWCIRNGRDELYQACEEFGVLKEMPRLAQQWAHMRTWIERERSVYFCEAEAKFAIDLSAGTARRLYGSGDRDYSESTPAEIPMTLDVLGLDDRYEDEAGSPRPPRVRDWKTGHSAEGYWGQIAINALAVAWWLKTAHPEMWNRYRCIEGGILHVRAEGIRENVHTFDAFELAAVASDLLRDVEAIAGAAPHKGDHCLDHYCQAFGVCPETAADVERVRAAAELLPATALVRHDHSYALSPTIVSADHAWWCKQVLRTFRAYADQVEDAVEVFVGDQSHPLTSGGVLKKTTKRMKRMSTPDLIALARTKGATDDEINACVHESIESGGIRVVGKPKEPALPKAS